MSLLVIMMTTSGVAGILPHLARQLSDAASAVCACLQALLQSNRSSGKSQQPSTEAQHFAKTVSEPCSTSFQHKNTGQQPSGAQTAFAVAGKQPFGAEQHFSVNGQFSTAAQQPFDAEQKPSKRLNPPDSNHTSCVLGIQQQRGTVQQQQQHEGDETTAQQQQALSEQQQQDADVASQQQRHLSEQQHHHQQQAVDFVSQQQQPSAVDVGSQQQQAHSQKQQQQQQQGRQLQFVDVDSKSELHAPPASQVADPSGVWQALVDMATTGEEKVRQYLHQQCRDDGLLLEHHAALAKRASFDKLAAQCDFTMASLSPEGMQILAERMDALGLEPAASTHALAMAKAAATCIAAASGQLQIAFGTGHQLWEINCFLPFSAGLPYDIAAAVVQAASVQTAETSL